MDHLTAFAPGNIKVLMTGAGAPGGPGIIKALQSAGYKLYVGDCNAFASGRFMNEKFIELPPADNNEFIDFILSYCLENGVQVIFPLVTRELFKFAQNKKRFDEKGIKVIVSDYDALSIANDKGKLYSHLSGQEVLVPHFRIVHTITDLAAAVKELGYPAKAVCIKPTISNGSRGVRILQQSIDEFDLLFSQKPNNLYSSLEKIMKILEGRAFPELLVSEYLPGIEYTIDTLVYKGVPKLILPRSRTKMNSGISVQGTFIKNDEIIGYCEQIICTLHLSGPIGLQVKKGEDGVFKLLEINPRIQGTSVAALGVGINLPALAVKQEFEPVDIVESAIKWGTSFVRYYEELFY
ncbi:MAG TPA: ATP-grasp domain-containing protein [Flavisolibacter sp.]|nr:ATP-grasp domain-containing protein [Flavisolibacter sp.]